MRPNTVFLAGGVLGLAFGLSFLLFPTIVLPLYGVAVDPSTVLMSRFFGVALFHLGIVLYLMRDVRESASQRALGWPEWPGPLGAWQSRSWACWVGS